MPPRTEDLKTHKLNALTRPTLHTSPPLRSNRSFVDHVVGKVLSWIKENTKVTKVRFFSDGCRAQFKNCHTFGASSQYLQSADFTFLELFEWHFFCSW